MGAPKLAQGGEDCGQVGGHPLGRAGAAVAGDADGLDVGEGGELGGRGRGEEEDGGDAIRGELLQDVGGAGEVVAVEGVEDRHGQAPKVSRAERSSGWVCGVGGERDAERSGLPGLLQAADAGGDALRMAHDAAAAGVDEVG